MFTIKRCSLIRGVHYERFHCIELLEIMFDGRAFHSLAVVGKKLCPNVLDECLI